MKVRALRGGKARKDGRWGEVVAALYLMAKGYQILAFRLRTRLGEVDLVARRGRVLAVIEVKRRLGLDDALLALSAKQRARLAAAGQAIAATRPALRNLDLRLDLIALAPGRLPRHVRNLTLDEAP